MFDYLYYDFARQAVCQVQKEKTEYILAKNLQSYLNQCCLRHGSTLEGRKQAFSILMNQKRYIPVLISSHPPLILFPTQAQHLDDTLWICYEAVLSLTASSSQCTLCFKDGLELVLPCARRIEQELKSIYLFLHILSQSSQSSQ